jgi:CRISPR/Cas system-associated exonuclease Cas4 (RecB family)
MATLLNYTGAATPPPFPEPERFSYRYFERFSPDALARIQRTISVVLDDRTRQFDLFDPPAPASAPDAADFATPAAAPSRDSELGATLSPSQTRCYIDCSARWWFKYGLKLPDPRNGNLALGSAVHKVHELYYKRKLAHEEPFDVEGALEIYRAAWAQQIEGDVRFDAGDDIDALEASGAALVSKWLAEGHPELIEPAAVEQRVAGVIGGVDVQGYIDLRDTSGRIIDLKTAKAKPSGIEPSYAFQLATYRRLDPAATGRAELVTLVKTKTPQLIRQEYEVSAADLSMVERVYPLVQDAIRDGIYVPNRNSVLCSRKNCPFVDACCKEFGGSVE